MHLLLTNDDGIDAPGLLVLARTLHGDGHRLTLVAPMRETSGSGTSVGSQLNGTLVPCRDVEIPGLDGVEAVAIDGPPALGALAACHGLIDGRPDLVISGINPGHNIGRLSRHSGTLGAATTVAAYGYRAVAVSCAHAPEERYEDTARFIAMAVALLAARDPDGVVFNINFPARPFERVAGVRAGVPALPLPGDVAIAREPGGFRVSVARDILTVTEDSDLALLEEGFITVTCAANRVSAPDVTGAMGSALDGLLGA